MPQALEPYVYPEVGYQPTIPAMISALVECHGSNDFIVSSVGDGTVDRITYAEADRQSSEMAAGLIAAGVTKGVRVGILAPNGPDFVVAFLAATRIGAVAVPINTFFQPPELAWLLSHADVHTLLAVDTILGKDILQRIEAATGTLPPGQGPIFTAGLPYLRNVLPLGKSNRPWPSKWPEPARSSIVRACESGVRPADDLVIIYTSGSTSDPKGVIHTHGTVIVHSNFIATNHGWTERDRVYIPMVFFWVGGLIFGLLGPMQCGVTIITEHRFEAGDVLRLLESEKATYATGFPHVGAALANDPNFAKTDLSSLKEGYQQVLMAADLRTSDPSLRVKHLGMSETCSSHTWWPPHEQLPESKRGSVGVSGPGFEHKIIGEDQAELPDGAPGEICVRGFALMRGMVGKQLSDVLDDNGWYHTGDAGHRDADGHIYFEGRIDDMIKTAGANVTPVEVESVLTSLDEVRIAYVVGIPDPDKGALVCGVAVLNEGQNLTPDELTAECKARLSTYKVPKRWWILTDAESLPYTTTDKIDKRRLAALLANGEL